MNVKTNGVWRNVVVIDESPKGDVYIRVKSGTQVGIPPNASAVVEDRYSIHPSPNSPNYTMLKHTLTLENGSTTTSAALTDAVKLKRGFSHLFSHRSSDLAQPVNDFNDDAASVLSSGDFDTRCGSLVFGIFVGHPNTGFPIESDRQVANAIRSQHFQIVLCHVWLNLPALPFSWTLKSLTIPPELYDDAHGKESAYRKMSGKSAESSLELFHGLANELVVNLLELYTSLAQDDEQKRLYRSAIDSVPRMASIRL